MLDSTFKGILKSLFCGKAEEYSTKAISLCYKVVSTASLFYHQFVIESNSFYSRDVTDIVSEAKGF